MQQGLRVKRVKRGEITNIILKAIGITGFVAVALVAPNSLKAFKQLPISKKYNRKYYVKSKLSRMEELGLITFSTFKGKKVIRLTHKGRTRLEQYLLVQKNSERKKKWDSKWRVIIFDIGEHRRRTRDNLRRQLVSYGFQKLQKSVWVYPFDCEELITLMKADLEIGKDVVYLLVEHIENDKKLKKLFGLE